MGIPTKEYQSMAALRAAVDMLDIFPSVKDSLLVVCF